MPVLPVFKRKNAVLGVIFERSNILILKLYGLL
jgi:hypothetical protein